MAALFYPSLVFISLFFSFTEATDFLVGGKADSWKIPSSESESLNKWAESSRFKVGDSLVWKFDAKKDSVLRVTKEDYSTCNGTNPIAEYTNGNTKVELDRSGPFYFISGVKGNCEKGQKLIVVVMSSRRNRISPAPSPMMDGQFDGPAVAPTSGSSSLSGSCCWGALMVVVVSLLKMGFLL
ncbi:Plastocyanin-like [Macleaya cordata]|uniref:Plastocyanin-like n=1 Tax=Macleaya cordata TaxID=56857 RepID=A0A200Q922_MACCD|nr:Plastocyanin-like [Macleaya cordata]